MRAFVADVLAFYQVGDGGLVLEGPFRNHRDVVAVERQNAEVLQTREGALLFIEELRAIYTNDLAVRF